MTSITSLPESYSDPKRYSSPPTWDKEGNRYADAHTPAAEWQPPTFAGEARSWVFIADRWYEILIEQGMGRNEAGIGRDGYLTRAYVVCDGQLVRRLELATNHTPKGTLVYYERGDLVMVGGANDPLHDSRAWKVKFAGQKLRELYVVPSDTQQLILLLTQSSVGETLYLMRT